MRLTGLGAVCQLMWLLQVAALLLLLLQPAEAASKRVKLCLQPVVSGRCFGAVESYAYNPVKRHCEAFIYGGCGGNENRFANKAECEYNCRDI